MKKHISLCLALLCALATVHASAAQDAAAASDEKAVAAAVEELRVAMTAPINRAALEKLVDDKLSYGHSGGHVQDKQEFIEQLASGKSTFVNIALTEQSITVEDDVAIVRHILTAATNDSGKPGNVALKILLVWKKHDGHWRLLARQAVHFNSP
ncbi:MAG: nuclear transport factor 2 family protein [Burkholderiaceae bacterium]|nr:nuclear transport factor 2 family protein [Burkholderiaceae bacterium]